MSFSPSYIYNMFTSLSFFRLFSIFLDASTHLYISVRPFVRLSVCPSIGQFMWVFFEPRKLIGNGIESLEKSRYGPVTGPTCLFFSHVLVPFRCHCSCPQSLFFFHIFVLVPQPLSMSTILVLLPCSCSFPLSLFLSPVLVLLPYLCSCPRVCERHRLSNSLLFVG